MPITLIEALDEDERQSDDEVKFVRAFNTDITALNTAIDLYNSTSDQAEKLTRLKQIDQLRNTLNNRYYLDDIARSPPYQAQMHDQLDREIREAFDVLAPPKEDDVASLSEIIRQMPHAKFTQLMAILWENTELTKKLNDLYKSDEKPGYDHFQQFINSHTIESLSVGMNGNSRNIRICKTGLGNIPLVLKVDERFGVPKSTEDYLRESQVGALAATYGQRQGSFVSGASAEVEVVSSEPSESQKQQVKDGHKILLIRRGDETFVAYRPKDGDYIEEGPVADTIEQRYDGVITNENDLNLIRPFAEHILKISTPLVVSRGITATLVITEYCPGSDLYAHAHKPQTDEARLSSALDYYTQMTDILSELQLSEVAFPDAKNQNWLIGRDNKLRISDTKSLRRTTDGKFAAFTAEDNPRFFPVRSPTHLPGELSTEFTPEFSADAMHVYMLGKNLYQSLTGCDSVTLKNIKSLEENIHFHHSIFQKTPIGEALKRLLVAMVQDNPIDRKITINDAKAALHDLRKAQPVADEINQLLEKIKSTSVSQPDPKMAEYIAKKIEEFQGIYPELKKLISFKEELEALYNQLVPVAKAVKQSLQKVNPTQVTSSTYQKIMSTRGTDIVAEYNEKEVISRVATPAKTQGIALLVRTISQNDRIIFQIEQMLKKIQATASLQPDPEMDKFIKTTTDELSRKTYTYTELQALSTQLTDLHRTLEPIATEVQTITKGFRLSRGIYRITSNEYVKRDQAVRTEKADMIQKTFTEIPVAERVNVLKDRGKPQIKAFQNALAWHRTASNKDQLNKDNKDADELTKETAAKTFNKFKEKFEDVVHRHDSDKESVSSKDVEPNNRNPNSNLGH